MQLLGIETTNDQLTYPADNKTDNRLTTLSETKEQYGEITLSLAGFYENNNNNNLKVFPRFLKSRLQINIGS